MHQAAAAIARPGMRGWFGSVLFLILRDSNLTARPSTYSKKRENMDVVG